MMKNILEMRHIRKEFPGVVALDDVDFSVREGEIHALVGENGAGKSTLMKVLSGVYPYGTYSGDIVIDGNVMKLSSIKDGEKASVVVIYQELSLIKYMNVCENIFLGNEIVERGLINWDESFIRANKALKDVNLNINPSTLTINLGVGTQQLVEIAKALTKNARLLVLDEPTSSLTETEIENLFQILRNLKAKGMTCIFISHKLKEVFEIADRVTVLCDGKTRGTFEASELTEGKLISLMVGRELTQRFPTAKHTAGETALEISNWTVINPEVPDKKALDDINFVSKQGEILGIAGLMGAGRTELFMSILGAWGRKVSGEAKLFGQTVNTRSPSTVISEGVAYLTEDRKAKGLVLIQNVKDNMALASLSKRLNRGLIDQDTELKEVEGTIEDLSIKTPTVEQLVKNLSGGNQQKVVLGKWLLTEPKVLILDEPTRGIDVGAKYEIYTIMHRLVERGISIIMISSELPEILGMSDRILVIREGKVAGELSRDEATQEKIIAYATGGM
ncbi:MAG: ATP-binding cassette domain-containing protein [Clostridiales bacterium]|nr:ATP-binding cassette domain-containing protein [Clostridiales bacterium]